MTIQRSHSAGHIPAAPATSPTDDSDLGTRAWLFLRSRGGHVPPALACPISYGLMLDPVSVANGQTYDRPSIRAWLASAGAKRDDGRFVDPRTGDALNTADLHPNLAVRAQVEAFKDAVLRLDPSVAQLFAPPSQQDVFVATPRRPQRPFGAAHHSANVRREAHHPRSSSPPSTKDAVAQASRTVAQAMAFAEQHTVRRGFHLDALRTELDDLAAWHDAGFDADTEADSDTDDEIRALRANMGRRPSSAMTERSIDSVQGHLLATEMPQTRSTRAFDADSGSPLGTDDEVEQALDEARRST